MGCYVRGDKNGIGCYVRGDKNSMGCFVRGGKSLWDVLSGVAKNGMGCFVPGCFVRLPFFLPLFKNIINVCALNLAGDINSSNLLVRYVLLNFRILEIGTSLQRKSYDKQTNNLTNYLRRGGAFSRTHVYGWQSAQK